MMSDQSPSPDSTSTHPAQHQPPVESPDPEPESGFIDRAERLETRQSSPTNPRVSDKPEENQEEA